MIRILFYLVVLLSAVLPVSPCRAYAQPRQAEEFAVKAAYLYNFAKFTEWPPEVFPTDGSPVFICVMGEDPFGQSLNAIRGKTIGTRKVAVRNIANIDAASACHILFISASEREHLDSIFEKARKTHLLTVSDVEHFDRSGGMVSLVKEGDRIRFAINADAAQQAGIKLSSQLLKLAITVKE